MKNAFSPIASMPALAALAGLLAASPAGAGSTDENVPFAAEIESCVATVNARLDLGNVKRVRHFVTDARRTGLGYVLTIETSVFLRSDSGPLARHYEVHCVARGHNAPSTFRIAQVGA